MPMPHPSTQSATWRYAGRTRAAHGQTLTCDACGQSLQIAYLLHDRTNRAWSWMGADCAAAADPNAEEAMRAARGEEYRTQIANALIRSLLELAQADPEFPAERFLFAHRKNDGWTPAQARTIAWRARKADVAIDPRTVRMRLRRGRDREQIATMTDWQFRDLVPFLTAAQLRACGRLRRSHETQKPTDE